MPDRAPFLISEKNYNYVLIAIFLFLAAVKLPGILTDDIQPWDEGMYAARVNAIHQHGAFFDQSEYSVGKFYSGSHPPLVIWIGYAVTSITGKSDAALKMIIFCFAIGSLWLLAEIARRNSGSTSAIISVLIFAGTILFHVFSKRFQFDIPYTFFILLSFYAALRYKNDQNIKLLMLGGISFGLCLMTKILVGVFIPLTLLTYVIVSKSSSLKIKDVLIITGIGFLLALPWHLYMIMQHGSSFFEYFLGFHIIDRAFSGVEQNTKSSGPFFHINYFLTIIPYGISLLFAAIEDLRRVNRINSYKLFLWIWFFTGLVIITFFRTKLEVYTFLILSPAALLISSWITSLRKHSRPAVVLFLVFTVLNILWYFSEYDRNSIKTYIFYSNKVILAGIIMMLALGILSAAAFIFSKISNPKIITLFIIVVTFLCTNFYYLSEPPRWDNTFKLSEIKRKVNNEPVIYAGTNYRFNPQLTYYFDGKDIEQDSSKFLIVDIAKDPEALEQQKKNYKYLIYEKDGINRSIYKNSAEVIPIDYQKVYETYGYELYQRR